MDTGTWIAVVVSLAAAAAIVVLWRHAVILRRQTRTLVEEAAQGRAAQQELLDLLRRHLALQEEKAAQEKARYRDEALPKFAISSPGIANGACTITLRNAGPTASRVRIQFRPPLATGATPQFDACQAGTTQVFAAQFEAGRPHPEDELRVSFVDASGCSASEIYGIEKGADGALAFHLKRRERAMWS